MEFLQGDGRVQRQDGLIGDAPRMPIGSCMQLYEMARATHPVVVLVRRSPGAVRAYRDVVAIFGGV